ncbi:RHS repeat domain-containing protein, partial [Neisseria bergeri]|uniref:RHS repeat domain-containing protein n=2 Tax=Neisseria bergeri TaxID=1906581 RepID=UPI0027E118BA
AHSTDQRTGTTHFEYDRLGRITQAGSERFAFDPAHNILSDHNSPTVQDNRLKTYNGTTYYYDGFGNLIHRELADGEVQNYFYDLHDQLVKAEIFKKDGTKETWAYTYDALGRRIGKGRLKNEEVSETSFPHDLSGNGLEEETGFVWDGSHLLQEVHPDGRYTYLYTDQDSYEPLAQVRNWTTEDGESRQQIHYFHCDQIGIPREMTDKDGNLVWFGDYYGWGKLRSETNISGTTHQPFRLQNQYCDRETGLHYNFFRYYEPECGRFINQDPIGLLGDENFYTFAPNVIIWIDILGWFKFKISAKKIKYALGYFKHNQKSVDKGKLFNKLGFGPKCMKKEITKLAKTRKKENIRHTEWGEQFSQTGVITSNTGETVKISLGWIIDKGQKVARLVTITPR